MRKLARVQAIAVQTAILRDCVHFIFQGRELHQFQRASLRRDFQHLVHGINVQDYKTARTNADRRQQLAVWPEGQVDLVSSVRRNNSLDGLVVANGIVHTNETIFAG